MACEDYESTELKKEGKHRFRSAMVTLLYLSQDCPGLQHAVRNLSQFMARPTVAAEAGVKHIILHLKGTPDLGILLGYRVSSKHKLDEVRGDPGSLESGDDVVEVFTDADWAGNKSTQVRKRHSVSSALVYVNNRLICSWSRTQKKHFLEQL